MRGGTRVARVYKGDRLVTKIYKGDELVYSLPDKAWYFADSAELWNGTWDVGGTIRNPPSDKFESATNEFAPARTYKVNFKFSFSNGAGGCSSVDIGLGGTTSNVNLSGLGAGVWSEVEAIVTASFTAASVTLQFNTCGGDYAIYVDNVELRAV